MSIRVYQQDADVFLTGAGAVPCMRWRRSESVWQSEPADLPTTAQSISVEQIPNDLREELLAFVARADAMGAAAQPSGN